MVKKSTLRPSDRRVLKNVFRAMRVLKLQSAIDKADMLEFTRLLAIQDAATPTPPK